MKTIRKAGAIIIKNSKMMIVKPFDKECFINPGGKYEADEDAFQCLSRELNEELKLKVLSFRHYKTYKIAKAAHSNNALILELYTVETEGIPTPSLEIEQFSWLSADDYRLGKYNLAPSFNEFVPEMMRDNLL